MKISKFLSKQVRERAQQRCEYCQTAEWLNGQAHQVDHITPRALGGVTTLGNLCLACVPCNSFKQDNIEAIDPETQQRVLLFNPRTQRWTEHFAWNDDGIQIIGLTSCGRATVVALQFNRPLIQMARAVWVSANQHPPVD